MPIWEIYEPGSDKRYQEKGKYLSTIPDRNVLWEANIDKRKVKPALRPL